MVKEGFYLIRHIIYFCFKQLTAYKWQQKNSETYEGVDLTTEHIYIREQPHAARIQFDNSITPLNCLRPLNTKTTTATASTVIPTPETTIVVKADNNPENQDISLKAKKMNWKQMMSLVLH